MSVATTSVQSSPEINTNSMHPQKSTSLHGRVFHKISDGGKCIIQSINKVAQSILSTCIYVVSFGRCDLDSLKSYFFSNQTALKDNETASSSSSPTRSAPPVPQSAAPPPPMPTSAQLNRASRAKMQEPSFQGSITSETLNESPGVRSSQSRQNSLEEDDNTLEDGTNSRRASLHENSNPVIEGQSNNQPNASPQIKKKGIRKGIKQVMGGVFAGMQDSALFLKIKQRNQE